jgi:hypothetical protein
LDQHVSLEEETQFEAANAVHYPEKHPASDEREDPHVGETLGGLVGELLVDVDGDHVFLPEHLG